MAYINEQEIETAFEQPSKKRMLKFIVALLNFTLSLLVWLLGSKDDAKKPEEPKK